MNSLFIGNLPWAMTAADLLELVSGIAPGSTVDLIVDRQTGRSKAFGLSTRQARLMPIYSLLG